MSDKKKVRAAFRNAVFKRDNFTCRVCKKRWKPEDADPSLGRINAHHITDRNDMPNGGYVVENGVTVCDGDRDSCHMRCERGEITKEYLYLVISSSYDKALKQSEKLSE